jgi:L-threonylcarbamoyladenylate synthase
VPVLAGTDPQAVQDAAALLAAGELVAFPTETVYGLGARADDDTAVAKIFAAKGRPADHPLIVHVTSIDAAESFAATLPVAARRLMAAFWPGPLTLIVPRREGRGAAAAAGQDSIGLRMPAHPVAQALLRQAAQLGVAGVAGPSANRFGRVSPTRAEHVAAEFGPALAVLEGGPCAVGIESAIVDCTRGRVALLRPGQLAASRIAAVLGEPLAEPDAASPRASGTLASHYAPSVPVVLVDGPPAGASMPWPRVDDLDGARAGEEPPDAGAPAGARPDRAAGVPRVVGVYSRVAPPAPSASGPAGPLRFLHRPMPPDAAAVAHELFAVLREFDAAGVSAIWVERPPPGPEWDGVRDRLQRAAA